MNTTRLELEANEEVLLQVRKHWFILAIQCLGIVITASLPIFLYALITGILPNVAYEISINLSLSIALYTAWLLILWMALFNIWTNYYLDVWTITNKRVIAVDQRGFFFRNTASFRLERVQDVIVSVHGIVATLLDYGTVEIQNASEVNNFIAHGLPKPKELKALIFKGNVQTAPQTVIKSEEI